MCGIIGVLTQGEAGPILLDALRRLEYRGYDSAGVAALAPEGLALRRASGKISALAALLEAEPLLGRSGIGHTRWATHGAPSEANAHPHRAGRVAVVHNGIIENWRALREALTAEGVAFRSDTDTEVVAQLCAAMLARGLAPEDAVAATLAKLEGAFALCFLFDGEDDLLVCARRGSPLAIGFGEGESFVGSDALALAPLTNRIAYLEEGDWAVLRRTDVRVFDASGAPAEREVHHLSVDAVLADKGGHRHFMAKEIAEQPAVAAYALGRMLSPDRRRIASPAEALGWEGAPRLTMVACGTAYYAAAVAKRWFESLARLPVEIDVASEYRYRDAPLRPGEIVLVVSQSGETADTLAALRHVRAQGAAVGGVINVETSTIAREADVAIPIHAGPEIGVASTKAFTGQLVALLATAIHAGRRRGALDAAAEAALIETLSAAPRLLAEALRVEPEAEAAARRLAAADSVLYIGRGAMHALALEAALKLKELTYIHAEGLAAGELKHGPIALVDRTRPVVAFAPGDDLFDKTASNISELLARDGRCLVVTDAAGAARLDGLGAETLVVPTAPPLIAPIVFAAPAQLLAYHAAVARGADVDQPRNLAKSVTVE